MQQGLNDSTNLHGEIEPFNHRQAFMKVSQMPGKSVLDQLTTFVTNMTLAESFNHTDICVVRSNLPFSSPLSPYKAVLEDDSLVLLHHNKIVRHNAELLARRRAGRQVIHIPAQVPAAVAAVPGDAREGGDELARLQTQLAQINARLQQLNPAILQPPLNGGGADVGAGLAAGGPLPGGPPPGGLPVAPEALVPLVDQGGQGDVLNRGEQRLETE